MELVTPTEMICYGAASNSFKEAVKDLPMVYMENFEGFHKAIADVSAPREGTRES